jgi:hypothetical protein
MLLSLSLLPVQRASAQQADPPAAASASEKQPPAVTLRLMEGSVVSGVLSIEAITVETAFGTLVVPIENVVSFTPGLDRHPEQRQHVARLIQELGSHAAAERDAAQRALADIGPPIRAELERYKDDSDAERRSRVRAILGEFDELDEADWEGTGQAAWIAEDTVETDRFTVIGSISPTTFDVRTKFGLLTVRLSDIRRAEREVAGKPEVRKSVELSAANFIQLSPLSTGVRVSRGDEVTIKAEGAIEMTPWGNGVRSTPDGGGNFDWYLPGQIPGGMLVARIGNGGEVLKVGSESTFTAKTSGILYLAIAMNSNYISQGYNFPGQYAAKIQVTPN